LVGGCHVEPGQPKRDLEMDAWIEKVTAWICGGKWESGAPQPVWQLTTIRLAARGCAALDAVPCDGHRRADSAGSGGESTIVAACTVHGSRERMSVAFHASL
jgi:hypothetical protein